MIADLARYTELDGIVAEALEANIPKAMQAGKWDKAIAYTLLAMLAQRERDGIDRALGDV